MHYSISKPARKPHPPSETQAKHILDLIHSDVCGPFPVHMPHGKLYFIIFLDDNTHLVNVQLLVSKDQVLEAWKIVKPLWENHAEQKVKTF